MINYYVYTCTITCRLYVIYYKLIIKKKKYVQNNKLKKDNYDLQPQKWWLALPCPDCLEVRECSFSLTPPALKFSYYSLDALMVTL